MSIGVTSKLPPNFWRVLREQPVPPEVRHFTAPDRRLLTASICSAPDRQEGDARRRKFDLTRRDVLTLEGGQFVIGAEFKILSVQPNARVVELLSCERVALRRHRKFDRLVVGSARVDREKRHTAGMAGQTLGIEIQAWLRRAGIKHIPPHQSAPQ